MSIIIEYHLMASEEVGAGLFIPLHTSRENQENENEIS